MFSMRSSLHSNPLRCFPPRFLRTPLRAGLFPRLRALFQAIDYSAFPFSSSIVIAVHFFFRNAIFPAKFSSPRQVRIAFSFFTARGVILSYRRPWAPQEVAIPTFSSGSAFAPFTLSRVTPFELPAPPPFFIRVCKTLPNEQLPDVLHDFAPVSLATLLLDEPRTHWFG